MIINCTASGTANAIVLTPADTTQPIALADEQVFLFKAVAANTDAVTVAYGDLDPVDAAKETPSGQVALGGGEIVAGNWYIGLRDAAANAIVIAPFTGAGASGLGSAAYADVDDVPLVHTLGLAARGHKLGFLDQNWVRDGDYEIMQSSDPTVQPTFAELGGTVTVGDVIGLNLHFDGSDHIVSYTAVSGDTKLSICNALIAAINANSTIRAIGTTAQILPKANPTVLVNPAWNKIPAVSGANGVGATLSWSVTASNELLDGGPWRQYTRYLPGRAGRAGDLLSTTSCLGQDDTGALTNSYGGYTVTVSDPTASAPAATHCIETPNGILCVDHGMWLKAQGPHAVDPTGGDKGIGHLNIPGLYHQNGVPLAEGGTGTLPTITTSGGSFTPTYGTRTISWSRAGDLVFVHMDIEVTSFSGSPSGSVIVNGLPKAAAAFAGQRGIAGRYLSGSSPFGTGSNFFLNVISGGTTAIVQYDGPSIGASDLNAASLGGSFRWVFDGVYQSA